MSTPFRILIVEDEPDLADVVSYNLRRAGYETEVVHDGAEAVRRATESLPDLLVLDIMIPKLSGLLVAKQLRSSPRTAVIPIIMLTARTAEAEQIAGLQSGADDYITKPFSTKVLLARVEAALRRSRAAPPASVNAERLSVSPIEADLATHQVWSEGKEISLTLTEFRLLAALLRKPARVIRRADLMYSGMGPDVLVTPRTIDVHIAAIRRKLGPAGSMIRTRRGVGYMLAPNAHQ